MLSCQSQPEKKTHYHLPTHNYPTGQDPTRIRKPITGDDHLKVSSPSHSGFCLSPFTSLSSSHTTDLDPTTKSKSMKQRRQRHVPVSPACRRKAMNGCGNFPVIGTWRRSLGITVCCRGNERRSISSLNRTG